MGQAMLPGAPHAPDSSASSRGLLSVTPVPWVGRLLVLTPTLETRAVLPRRPSGTLFTLDSSRLVSARRPPASPLPPPGTARLSCPLPAPGRLTSWPFLRSCDPPAFAGIVREPVSLARGGPGRGCALPSNTGAPRLAEAPFPIARLAHVTPEGRLCRWAAWV